MVFNWLVNDKVAGSHLPGRIYSLSDDLESLRANGFSLIVSIYDPKKEAELKFHNMDLSSYGMSHWPIKCTDYSTPDKTDLKERIQGIITALNNDEKIFIHCGAGIGRTGTVMACFMKMYLGISGEASIKIVRNQYFKGAIETEEQEEFVNKF